MEGMGDYMQWSELFAKEHQPTENQIRDFVGCPLWDDLGSHLQQEYNVKPKISHSSCAMDGGMWKGWNVKYQKNGKALCTVYPKQGYFLALMPFGARELNEVELLMPLCTAYTQSLFSQAVPWYNGNKSLALEVTDEGILDDMKKLVAIRIEAMKAKP